jgi:hypothetical protein
MDRFSLKKLRIHSTERAGDCDLIGNFCAQLRSRVRALVLSDFLDDGDFLRNGFHGRGVSLSD